MPIQLTNPTPLYAAVGAGDALVAKVRGADVPKVNFDVDVLLKDLKTVQGQAKAIRVSELPSQFKKISIADLQTQVRSLQTQLKSVQGQVQHTATDTVGQLGRAYTDFAKRGEEVVTSVRQRDFVGDVRSGVDDLAGKARSGAADVIGDVKGRVGKVQRDVEPTTKPVTPDEPTAKPATEAATSKPAAKSSTAKASSTKASTAKKAPAKKSSTASKSTATKSAAKKSTPKKS